jgi:hypothetical protein
MMAMEKEWLALLDPEPDPFCDAGDDSAGFPRSHPSKVASASTAGATITMIVTGKTDAQVVGTEQHDGRMELQPGPFEEGGAC